MRVVLSIMDEVEIQSEYDDCRLVVCYIDGGLECRIKQGDVTVKSEISENNEDLVGQESLAEKYSNVCPACLGSLKSILYRSDKCPHCFAKL